MARAYRNWRHGIKGIINKRRNQASKRRLWQHVAAWQRNSGSNSDGEATSSSVMKSGEISAPKIISGRNLRARALITGAHNALPALRARARASCASYDDRASCRPASRKKATRANISFPTFNTRKHAIRTRYINGVRQSSCCRKRGRRKGMGNRYLGDGEEAT